MNRIPQIVVTLLAIVVVVSLLPSASAQRRFYGGQRNMLQLTRRIDALEWRVNELERLVGRLGPANVRAQTPETIEKAEHQVATAQQRLAFSEGIYRKGYISQAELEADQFELTRARKALELAEAVRDNKPAEGIASEIELLDATHDLAVAERQLRLVDRIAAQGYAAQATVEAHKRAVAEAQQRLSEATAKAGKSAPGHNPGLRRSLH